MTWPPEIRKDLSPGAMTWPPEFERPFFPITPEAIATRIENCRACGSGALVDIFSLGSLAVARFSEDSQGERVKAPLDFCWCEECTYLQLRHNIRTDLVFYPEYGYVSGVNPAMVRELGSIVESTRKIVDLKKGEIYLDIASNDGTLLLQVEGDDTLRVGFDPSKNVAAMGAANLLEKFGTRGFKIFMDYFNKETWRFAFQEERKAKIVTAIAVFYSVQEPNKFLDDVKSVLDGEGIFVVQQNYTPKMVEQNAFCNIVHEHVTYPTLGAFNSLVRRHGLKAVDVQTNDINGGSFRVYMAHEDSMVKVDGGEDRVAELLEKNNKWVFWEEGFMKVLQKE